MPSSILEDSSLLRPSARVICVLLFFAGLSMVALAMSSIGKGVEMLKNHSAKERVSSVADSIPEEMSFVLPPVTNPKTKEEQILRARQTEDKLNVLVREIKVNPKYKDQPAAVKDPRKLIAFGVLTGMIHPKEGQKILEEISILKIDITERGVWVSPYSDGKDIKTQR